MKMQSMLMHSSSIVGMVLNDDTHIDLLRVAFDIPLRR